jgi:hypothetical protein
MRLINRDSSPFFQFMKVAGCSSVALLYGRKVRDKLQGLSYDGINIQDFVKYKLTVQISEISESRTLTD